MPSPGRRAQEGTSKVNARSAPGYMGAAIFDRHEPFSTKLFDWSNCSPRKLSLHAIGWSPSGSPGAEERVARRLRAGVVERVGQRTASWRPDRPRSLLLSPRPSRARGAEFRVFLFLKRPGVVREEEENAPNTAWNVTRNIADPKSRIIPFSFCFSCSMRPTSFLHFQL